MNPQDRPARRFDEPPAYEDLELYVNVPDSLRAMGATVDEESRTWTYEAKRYDPDIAARSHLGAIVIVAAIVGLALIAAALFVRGAS